MTNEIKNQNQKSTTMRLEHVPLRPETRQILSSRGFETVEEVEEVCKGGGISNLAAELDRGVAEAASIRKELQQALFGDENCQPGQKAKEMLRDCSSRHAIITFCRQIDLMLGGGISIGELTEIAGEPGAGKTQWCLQLAVDASLPSWAGGVDGGCVYIDTEGSFSSTRAYRMAAELIRHINNGIKKRKRDSQLEWNATPEQILQNIHVIRLHDEAAMHACIEGSLPAFLEERAAVEHPIRLVIVDSIAFPIRSMLPPSVKNSSSGNKGKSDREFYSHRSRQLALYASRLSQLASDYYLASVVVNQMTTKVDATGTSQLVPALGESWAHAVTTRLVLSVSTEHRLCTLAKSPRLPLDTSEYQIVAAGIRGDCYLQTRTTSN